jgi:hypothetical protein
MTMPTRITTRAISRAIRIDRTNMVIDRIIYITNVVLDTVSDGVNPCP